MSERIAWKQTPEQAGGAGKGATFNVHAFSFDGVVDDAAVTAAARKLASDALANPQRNGLGSYLELSGGGRVRSDGNPHQGAARDGGSRPAGHAQLRGQQPVAGAGPRRPRRPTRCSSTGPCGPYAAGPRRPLRRAPAACASSPWGPQSLHHRPGRERHLLPGPVPAGVGVPRGGDVRARRAAGRVGGRHDPDHAFPLAHPQSRAAQARRRRQSARAVMAIAWPSPPCWWSWAPLLAQHPAHAHVLRRRRGLLGRGRAEAGARTSGMLLGDPGGVAVRGPCCSGVPAGP